MAALGFFFVTDSGIPASDLIFLRNMLLKVVADDGYDAATLLIVNLESLSRSRSPCTEWGTPSRVVADEDVDLHPDSFMTRLVEAVLDRSPASYYGEVRRRRGLDVDEGPGAE